MKYAEIYVELLRRNQKIRNDITALRWTRARLSMTPEQIVPENLDLYGNTYVHWLELIDTELDKYVELKRDYDKLLATSKNTHALKLGIQLAFREVTGLQDLEFDDA